MTTLLNTLQCGNRKKHKKKPNLPLDTGIPYLVVTLYSPHSSSSVFLFPLTYFTPTHPYVYLLSLNINPTVTDSEKETRKIYLPSRFKGTRRDRQTDR
jgi:hypothetical protein